MRRPFKIAAILLAVAMLLACLGLTFPLEVGFYLFAGWALFLRRVLPEVQLSIPSFVLAVGMFAVFILGTQGFLYWFRRAQFAASSGPKDDSATVWRWQWTCALAAIVIITFVAGICMVGVTHQVAWLATSEEPLVDSGFRGTVRRVQSLNNLKQIGLGVLNYNSAHKMLPASTMSPQGQLLHGWQTQLLPFLEQVTLHRQIDLKRPWNDPVNAPLFKKELSAYMIDGHGYEQPREDGYGASAYAANVHLFGNARGQSFSEASPGAANTILAGEVSGDLPAWGHPANWRDPLAGLDGNPQGFGSPWPQGVQFVFGDGRAKVISRDIDPSVLRAMAKPDKSDIDRPGPPSPTTD